jgi:hypothetical protein
MKEDGSVTVCECSDVIHGVIYVEYIGNRGRKFSRI